MLKGVGLSKIPRLVKLGRLVTRASLCLSNQEGFGLRLQVLDNFGISRRIQHGCVRRWGLLC